MATITGEYWAGAIDEALRKLVGEAGMDIAFGARATPDGRQLVIKRTRGARTTALRDLVVHGGTGLGGKAMVLKRPVAVNDYVKAQSISHHYDQPVSLEGIYSIVAVPLLVSGRVNGVLYAALRQRLRIGDRAQGTAMAVARETQRLLARMPWPGPAASPQRRRLRGTGPASDVGADLRSIIDRIDDPHIRAELEDIRVRLTAQQRAPATSSVLSGREYEALRFAALGLGNVDIAKRMGLLPGTVKAYLRSVMNKLDCHNRIAAVNAARALGYDL